MLNIQKSLIVSAVNGLDVGLDPMYFDYKFQPFIREINKRKGKECLKTLCWEYEELEDFDYTPLLEAQIKFYYNRLKKYRLLEGLPQQNFNNLKITRLVANRYRRIILNSYLFNPSLESPLPLDIFVGTHLKIAKLINRAIKEDKTYLLLEKLDSWAEKQDESIQNGVLNLYISPVVKDVLFYIKRMSY